MLDELGGLDPPPVTEKEFLTFLRTGQAYLGAISEPAKDVQLNVDGPLADKFAADARAVGLPGCAEVPP